MRIALQNAFPNARHTAEAEWIRRCIAACERLGFSAVSVVSSDDIMEAKVDCVLATHHFTPKLTSVPTIGLMWNAPVYFAGDQAAHDAILSYDGHLCGSEPIAQWVDDFLASRGKESVIHEGLMLPSSPDSGPADRLPPVLRLMYAGIHWDGSRHGEVFRHLDGQVPMDIYGPPEAWKDRPDSYRGPLPFDGTSVIEALRRSGVALCLHKGAHRDWNCPSMRLFEAAAAGALIITDDFEFPRVWFRNAALYVNPELPPPQVARQVIGHLRWAAANPMAAQRLATRANELFRSRLSLESMLSGLPEYLDKVRERRSMVRTESYLSAPPPTVEYVVRVGLRSTEMIARALDSLAEQTWPSIAVTLLQFHPVPGLDALIDAYRDRFAWIHHVIVANDGNRATSLWAGVSHVSAEYFGILDDDDTFHPNHVASLMECLKRHPRCGFAYSGLMRVHDDEGHFFSTPRDRTSRAPLATRERRELFSMYEEEFHDLSPVRNVIGIHAWVCRRELLDEHILKNPRLDLSEDVFLMASLAERTEFVFSGMATAEWRWRQTQQDNWTLSHPTDEARAFIARWHLRGRALKFIQRKRPSPPEAIYDFAREVERDRSPGAPAVVPDAEPPRWRQLVTKFVHSLEAGRKVQR
ncbi:glycosyltransferase [Roseomonas terrae]|uniref:Glycosyltransferase n=1 Tax=Neoroseomonas terrae TaxID=424799 RepID=A0ABS5EFE2_9PROT|nr:glycosyltransferase [Neoroseomonas terrae]MBR0649734.1 glycosyltransferase [Neoroseomonas terrae]